MFRRLPLVAVLAVSALLMIRFVPVHAQTEITPDALDTQLLTADELANGWSVVAGDATAAPDGTATAFRIFERGTDTVEVAGVALFANPDGSAPSPDLLAAAQGGVLLTQFVDEIAAGDPAAGVSNLEVAGAQGIGDSDLAATFTLNLNNISVQFAGDVWLHGNTIAVAFYGAPATTVDAPTALQQAVAIAQQQNTKLGS